MNSPIPSLVFVFPDPNQDIRCGHCGEPIDYSDGKPMAMWGMNDAPLHRSCANAYIKAEGWASPTSLNIYQPSCKGIKPLHPVEPEEK